MNAFEKKSSIIAKLALFFCNLIKSHNQIVVIEATIGKAYSFLERKELLSQQSLAGWQ
jgi:hypothetical protein